MAIFQKVTLEQRWHMACFWQVACFGQNANEAGKIFGNLVGGEIMGIHGDVSKNRGTPKSSILIGFSIINHPFWGTTIFGNTHGVVIA